MKRRMKRHTVVQPLDQSYRLIPLTQGQNAIVDAEDYDFLMQWNWTACWDPKVKTFYAYRRITVNGKSISISMHRALLNCDTPHTDHADGNGLNNRRSNLRPCSVSQNIQNMNKRKYGKSGFKGVSRKGRRWRARIRINGVPTLLGNYNTPEEAAAAYNKAAEEHFGEFAHINALKSTDIKETAD